MKKNIFSTAYGSSLLHRLILSSRTASDLFPKVLMLDFLMSRWMEQLKLRTQQVRTIFKFHFKTFFCLSHWQRPNRRTSASRILSLSNGFAEKHFFIEVCSSNALFVKNLAMWLALRVTLPFFFFGGGGGGHYFYAFKWQINFPFKMIY